MLRAGDRMRALGETCRTLVLCLLLAVSVTRAQSACQVQAGTWSMTFVNLTNSGGGSSAGTSGSSSASRTTTGRGAVAVRDEAIFPRWVGAGDRASALLGTGAGEVRLGGMLDGWWAAANGHSNDGFYARDDALIAGSSSSSSSGSNMGGGGDDTSSSSSTPACASDNAADAFVFYLQANGTADATTSYAQCNASMTGPPVACTFHGTGGSWVGGAVNGSLCLNVTLGTCEDDCHRPENCTVPFHFEGIEFVNTLNCDAATAELVWGPDVNQRQLVYFTIAYPKNNASPGPFAPFLILMLIIGCAVFCCLGTVSVICICYRSSARRNQYAPIVEPPSIS